MIDFETFLQTVRTDLGLLAEDLGRNYAKEVVKDGTDYAKRFKDRIERRITLLADGKLTKDEFEWLMKAEKNLVELKTIKKKGLAIVQLNRIRDAIIDTMIGAALKSINL